MAKQLLALYMRVGTGAARLALKLTTRAVKVAGSAVGLTDQHSGQRTPSPAPPSERPPAEPERHDTAATVEPEPEPRTGAQVAEIDYDAAPMTPLDPASAAAKTIDDEPQLVEELAEPGAEDGAGAVVEVEPPWDGYDELVADEVIARIDEASAAELAVLQLYERAHKQRPTVIEAAERRHKAISGPAAR